MEVIVNIHIRRRRLTMVLLFMLAMIKEVHASIQTIQVETVKDYHIAKMDQVATPTLQTIMVDFIRISKLVST